jgi:polyisoprenoid-binding protein YceI
MKRFALTFIALLTIAGAATQAQALPSEYNFDEKHTRILFKVNHAGFSDYTAEFTRFEGQVKLDFDNPEKSSVRVRVMPSGIKTGLPSFDDKLQGKEWFNSVNHPVALFKSTNVKLTSPTTAEVTGDFTMLGVTKPLTLHVKHNKHAYDQWQKSMKSGFSITSSFNRSDWGFKTYVPVIGDKVDLIIETEVYRPLQEGEKPE